MTCTNNSVIHWNGSDSFDIDISLPLRKEKVDRITGYNDRFMIIRFMDEEAVRVDYPVNLDDLPDLIEIKLLRWKNWKKRLFPNAYFILIIVNHVKEHLREIKDAISMMGEKRYSNPADITNFK